MANTLERLKSAMEGGKLDLSLLDEAENEQRELRSRLDRLEELLIMIVRTGWPWDDEGEPNAIHHAANDGFAAAMAEARELLGLGRRSMITRTEPRT
jgi:hypothetical protein